MPKQSKAPTQPRNTPPPAPVPAKTVAQDVMAVLAARGLIRSRKPAPEKDPYEARVCRFCKLTFKPACKDRGNARKQQFCCTAHQKEFWKHGTQPLEKLVLRLEKRFEAMFREIAREVAREEIANSQRLTTA